VYRGKTEGTGVSASHSSIIIDAYYSSVDEYINNTFSGLFYGVINVGKNTNFTTKIRSCMLSDNYHGIYTNSLRPTIIQNTFQVPNQVAGLQKTGPYGIYIEQTTGFKVEENIFVSLDQTNGMNEATHGIVVKNTGGDNNELYKNTFSLLNYAITSNGTNLKISAPMYDGLRLLCNDMSFGTQDIDIYRAHDYQGICQVQNTTIPCPGYTIPQVVPAENLFSRNCLPIDECEIKMPPTSPLNFHLFYYYDDAITSFTAAADRRYPYSVSSTVTGVQIPVPGECILCQSKLSGGSDISQSYTELITAFQAFNSAKLLLEITENGGIPELVEQVELTLPWEVYDQYNLLMLESPNLTEEVLIAAIENSEFPALLIKLLCLANPHSSRSADVMGALSLRVPALSSTDITEIEDQHELFTQFGQNALRCCCT
jgi:hypothetical protein